MEFIPLVVSGSGIALAKGQEKDEIMDSFYQRNRELILGAWKAGWHDFCESMKGHYLNVIKEACMEGATEEQYKMFGHFLDCEAHTDVWRELFPSANLTNEK